MKKIWSVLKTANDVNLYKEEELRNFKHIKINKFKIEIQFLITTSQLILKNNQHHAILCPNGLIKTSITIGQWLIQEICQKHEDYQFNNKLNRTKNYQLIKTNSIFKHFNLMIVKWNFRINYLKKSQIKHM